jgi:glycosyltransferase involved in cell wall biosynthesis
MLAGFKSGVPKTVELNGQASVDVFMNVPNVKESWLDGQHRVCFTMWETDVLPESFVRWLPLYDQIIVPCDHNVELFSRYHNNVSKVQLGVDTKFWFGYTAPDGPFRFLAGGSLWFRKGLDVVVQAFLKLDLPDAELHIKAAPHARDTPDVKDPRVVLHRRWMDLETQKDWFKQGHVFVAPSRGEGFGLMPLQAISLGMPTIVSDSTGHQEFSYLATGVVPTSKSPSEKGGQWDEPDIDALAELMLDHHRNWSTHQTEAVVNSRGASAFTWRKAAKALLDAVPVGEILPDTAVVSAIVNFDVQVKRRVSCNIAKTQYEFYPGETYWVSEDVKRVLNDAGYLV